MKPADGKSPASGPQEDPLDPAVAQLRAAQHLLDEHPRDGVRLAVMRAAADLQRQGAEPQSGLAERRTAETRSPKGAGRNTWRWWPSLAAISTICVVLLAVDLERHRPGNATAIRQPAAPSVAASRPTEANRSAETAAEPVPAAAAPVPLSAPSAPAPSGATSAGTVREPGRSDFAAVPKQSDAMLLARPGVDAAGSMQAADRAAARQAPRTGEAGPAAAAMPDHSYRSNIDDWLRRIVELRAAHRDHEADEESSLFRAAHPDAIIPSDTGKAESTRP